MRKLPLVLGACLLPIFWIGASDVKKYWSSRQICLGLWPGIGYTCWHYSAMAPTACKVFAISGELTALSGRFFLPPPRVFAGMTLLSEHFLSKDPEKVGETGPAIWPDWGVDPWRSPNLTKERAGSEKEQAR
jgi:hypothetical protein